MTKPQAAADGAAAPPPLRGREYRPIPDFPGYIVCSAGFVWSCLRHCSKRREPFSPDSSTDEYRPLKASTTRWGYLSLSLTNTRAGVKKRFFVHRLVLEAFVGPRPPGQEARHLDGSKHNNTPSNLAWGTKKENAEDKRRHGAMPNVVGSANPNAKLTEDEVRKILELYSAGVRPMAIALRFQLPRAAISRIVHGKGWRHVRQSMPTDPGKTRDDRKARGSRHGSAKLTESDVVKILDLFAAEIGRRVLADQFQVSEATICLILRGEHWRHVPRLAPFDSHKSRYDSQVRGGRVSTAKLTESDVIKIIELRASGVTPRALASRFQVSLSTISSIINGTTWKHVPR